MTESEKESESGWRAVSVASLAGGPGQNVRLVSVSGSERQLAEAFLDHGPMSAKLAGQRAGFSTDYATMLCRSMHMSGALEPAGGGKYDLGPGTRKYLRDKRAQDEKREQEREKERRQRRKQDYSTSEWPFE